MTYKENLASSSNNRYRKLAFFLLFAVSTLTGYAQSRFTYGVEAGAGSAQLDMSFLYGGTTPFHHQYVDVTFWNARNDRRRALQIGGYARYYLLSAIYVQSGLYYASDGGQEELIKNTYLGDAADCSGGCELREYRQRVNYTFHYGEVPLLVGVRLFQQLRLYGGFSGGLVLGQNAEVAINDPYELNELDWGYTSARLGIGLDAHRFSMDIFFQKTVSDNGGGWDATAEVPGYFGREGVYSGASDVNITKVLATIGYRLY